MKVKISNPYILKSRKLNKENNKTNYNDVLNEVAATMVRETRVSYEGDAVKKINSVYNNIVKKNY